MTIIELVVVLGIIAVLLVILLPAVQSFRLVARDTVCINNLRQLNLALEQLRGSHPRLPVWKHDSGTAGGWSVAILPFIDPSYGSSIAAGMTFDSIPDEFRKRPTFFTCPLAPVDSTDMTWQRVHYVLSTTDHRSDWSVMDVPNDFIHPWLAGVETDSPSQGIGPHRGGFYRHLSNGELGYYPGNAQ